MLGKNIILLLLIITSSGYCAALFAKDTPAQKALETRRHLVQKHLPLTAREAQDFWPVYDQYLHELMHVYIQRKALISKLGHNFDAMTDEVARELVTEFIAMQQERLRILHFYIKKLDTVLPGKKLLRLYQIETRFRSAVDSEIAEKIPLLK
jgi:hypothetical protein